MPDVDSKPAPKLDYEPPEIFDMGEVASATQGAGSSFCSDYLSGYYVKCKK